MSTAGSSRRRPLLLWFFVLWLAAMGAASLWRAATLWQTRVLLAELGSTLCPPATKLCVGAIVFVILYLLCGTALIVSACGLWLKRAWARHLARTSIVLNVAIVQAYTWFFVRTGLLWERRWIALLLSLGTAGIIVGALTWRKSRHWLGLA